MGNLNDFLQRQGVADKSELFNMVLGEENAILPGGLWCSYLVAVGEDGLVCFNDKQGVEQSIPYTSFQKAEFGIGSGNLWLQCIVNGSPLNFCSPRKNWKSPQGKKLIEKINAVTPVEDMKEYEHFTGKLFLLYMFK